MVDPNPLVSGRGLDRLHQAGIETHVGLLAEECRQLNEAFIKHVTTGRPFVLLKMASTLDGWSGTVNGDSKWITSEASRTLVHRYRSRMDAVMVGIETVLADDPLLTCRHIAGRNPLRVIVDSRLRLPHRSQIWSTAATIPTLVATTVADPAAWAPFTAAGLQVMACSSRAGRVDLEDLLCRLGALGVQSVLLEGGASLAGAALSAGVVDKLALFYAPKLLGGAGMPLLAGSAPGRIADGYCLSGLRVRRIATDFLVEGYLSPPCLPA
jgi:diaminohydroxyphosphoribosylaminopyrimidine deaminase/5-amino-6-(5-phosphoribosylamino)uracil reductase